MKQKYIIFLIFILVAAITGFLCFKSARCEPMYFHRDGLYEISPDGTVTLLTEQPVSTVHDGVLYSLVETKKSWSMTRNGYTYLEQDLYYPEDDPSHRASFSPCGSRHLLSYANYGGTSKLFYPFLSLEDEKIHLVSMDDDADVFAYLDFAVDNSFLCSYDDKIYFLLDLEEGRCPARLDWEVGSRKEAVQLSEISANMGGQIWLSQDQFWWIHYDQESKTTSLCRVPLSGGETTVTELPDGYFLSYISEDHVYYYENGILKVYSFRTNNTAAYQGFTEYAQICTAASWGALITENGENFYLLLHDNGKIIDLGKLTAKEDKA